MQITLNLVVIYWLLVLGCVQSFKKGQNSGSHDQQQRRQYILYSLVIVYLIASTILTEEASLKNLMIVGIVLWFVFWPIGFILGKRTSKRS